MDEEKTLQSSFLSIIYGDVISQLRNDREAGRLKTYKALVATIVADGLVTETERKKLEEYKQKLKVTDEEHYRTILDEGWTAEDWARGTFEGLRSFQTNSGRSDTALRDANTSDVSRDADADKLRYAADIVQGVASRLQASR